MQPFILEEQLEVICDKDGREYEEVIELEKEEFFQVMLKIHEANSSRKWRSMIKNAKMEKSDLSLNTYLQYVEDFKFWVMAAGNAHRIPEKEIAKLFVSGLKPDIFREEIYARSCESLVDVMAETRNELSNYRKIIDIKLPEVKKDSKDRMPEAPVSRKSGSHTKSHIGASFAKDSKPSNSGNTRDIKDVECFKSHKKGHYAKKCPDAKAKDGRGYFEGRQLEARQEGKDEEKSIRQIRIRHSDLNTSYQDPFLRYWIKIHDLSGPVRDLTHPGYLTIWLRCS